MDTQKKWAWMMDWCNEHSLAPAIMSVWNRADDAYEDAHKKENEPEVKLDKAWVFVVSAPGHRGKVLTYHDLDIAVAKYGELVDEYGKNNIEIIHRVEKSATDEIAALHGELKQNVSIASVLNEDVEPLSVPSPR